jgi:hypothetical protein
MEWVLQLVDEIDDVCAAWRQWWLRAAPEMAVVLAGCWGVLVFAITSLVGPKAVALAACAIALSSSVALSMQRRFTGYNRP